MNRARLFAFSVLLSLCLTAVAQKGKEDRLRKESQSAYRTWQTNDVGYIITPEERAAFNRLQNDEEREQFIEQFWVRRDPTPDTVENEFKEEHYRRIAYANEHFASGTPGWKTDRGHIYIVFGPPDSIEPHPSGGSYTRPASEGGGNTSTYPFEQWRYRHMEDIGEDIVLEFVDQTMSGEYRLTTDPSVKDALLYVPGAGLTQAEMMGYSSKSARFSRTDGTHRADPIGGDSASMNEFERLSLESRVFQPPKIRADDRQTAFITTGIYYNVLPMKVRVDFVPVTESSVLTYVAMQFENRDLQFVTRDGVQRAAVHIVGRISTMNRRIANVFEDTVVIDSPSQMLETMAQRKSVYSKSVPLAPGAYRLDVVAKDSGGNVSNYQMAMIVPHLDAEKLQASSLILADSMELTSTRSIGTGQFVIGDTKVRPRVDGVFQRNERLGVYLKVYNLAPSAEVEYEVVRAGTDERVTSGVEVLAASGQATIKRFFNLKDLAPGQYTVRLKIGTLTPSATFTVR